MKIYKNHIHPSFSLVKSLSSPQLFLNPATSPRRGTRCRSLLSPGCPAALGLPEIQWFPKWLGIVNRGWWVWTQGEKWDWAEKIEDLSQVLLVFCGFNVRSQWNLIGGQLIQLSQMGTKWKSLTPALAIEKWRKAGIKDLRYPRWLGSEGIVQIWLPSGNLT